MNQVSSKQLVHYESQNFMPYCLLEKDQFATNYKMLKQKIFH